MALARNLRTLIVLGTVASLMVTGAIWAHQAVAQAVPECPPDWPSQQYGGPLREEDHGRIQYEGFHADGQGQHWYIIRGADSNGYTTVRAYPAAQVDGGYITGSPDRVCYLIVREPGAAFDLDEPRQVLFPRESDEPAESASAPGPVETPTPVQPGITPTVPVTEEEEVVLPMLTSLELDGVTVDTDEVIREGLEPGQEVQVTLRVSDPAGDLAYLALVAEDSTELDRVDCTNGMEHECTLTSTITAPSAYSATLRLVAIAVDDVGTETELATITLTTRAPPSSTSTSGSGSGSSGSGSSGSGGGSSGSGRVRLEIERPEPFGPFIADIPAVIYPVVEYTGRYRLYFTLPQGPEGMVIDPNSGVVTWMPQEDDEGRSFDVTVAVTDGTLFEEATFEITVMDPQRIRSSLTRSETDGNVLEITDPDTNLEGLSITSPEDEPPITVRTLAELQQIFELAPEENIPVVPDWITPLTDVFVVKGPFQTPVELRLPIGELVDELPEGVQFTDVNLYAYAEISEVDGLFWTPVSVGFSFEGTHMDDLTYIVSLEGMQGLAFFGYHVNEPAMPFAATPQDVSHVFGHGDEGFHAPEHRPTNIALHYDPLHPSRSANPIHDVSRSIADWDGAAMCGSWAVVGNPLCPDPVPVEDIDCQFRDWGPNLNTLLHGGRNDYRCTYKSDPDLEEPDVEILVKGFGEGCRWEDTSGPVNERTKCSEGRSVRDIAAWLIGAQSAFDELELVYDKGFTVHIHPFQGAKGFVDGGLIERAGTLHIIDNNTIPYQDVKHIVLHEYVHHAQTKGGSFIDLLSLSLPFYQGDASDWLTEGTADWFPDEVDDTLNPLVIGNRLGARILEVGLHSPPPDTVLDKYSDFALKERYYRRNSYERSAFFKLMTGKCADFYSHVKTLLYGDDPPSGVSDRTGIRNLIGVIAEAECDFGGHLDHESALILDGDRSASIEAAITYYNYATQLKDDLSLLDDNEAYFHFNPPDFDFEPSIPRALPASLPEDESLIYTLTFPPFPDFKVFDDVLRFTGVFVPPIGAFSAKLPMVSGRLPEGTVAELIVVPDGGELIVSIAGEKDRVSEDDFFSMNTIGPDNDLHAWFSTDDSYSYVISETTIPSVFFTVANPHPHDLIRAGIFLRIRDKAGGKPPRELVEPLIELSSTDRSVLVDLYNSSNGARWTNNYLWLETDSLGNEYWLGSWYGVQLDKDGRVEAVTLHGNRLEGTIPESLGDLDRLKALRLDHNNLSGGIPAALGNLNILLSLNLRRNELAGQIPASLGELKRVYELYLDQNRLNGEIPSELGSMSDLEYLNLAENELTGEIPGELGELPDLTRLVLSENELTGEIPKELGSLTELRTMKLNSNDLTGEIPGEFGNLENLKELELGLNDLTGNIPEELGDLGDLENLDLGGNDLSGDIPETFEQLQKLKFLDLGGNEFTGDPAAIMSNLLTLPLERLDLSDNGLTGEVPYQFGTLIFLERFYLDGNQLDSAIPQVLGRLPLLERLHLHNNLLTNEIPAELGGLTFLERLRLDGNQLDGEIPKELGDLGSLEYLYLNGNMLSGSIPAELGNLYSEELGGLYSLQRLYLHENMLSGSIPATLGDLYNLERLYLYDNGLTGSIPAELGKLGDQSVLDELRLENNQLSGAIPAELGDLVSLTELILSNNMLSGAIPTALGGLTNLELLHLNNNGLTEAIPAELGDLEFLTELDLSHNQLAEAIPADLGDLTRLETLYLNNNALTGMIPTELGSLSNLRILHLNSNQLEGGIPAELGQLTNLEELVLDSNLLVSTIPAELANLTNLKVLHLSGNTITDCIPQGLTDIADNDLSQLNLEDCS